MKQEIFQSQDLDAFRQTGTLFFESDSNRPYLVQRVIILFSNPSFSSTDLAIKLNHLSLQNIPLIFLAKIKNVDRRQALASQIMLLEKLISSSGSYNETFILDHGSLSKELETIWREGDLVICMEDTSKKGRLFPKESMGEKISMSLHLPVLVLQETLGDHPSAIMNFLKQLAIWVSNLVAIILFALLQIKISQGMTGGAGQIVLLLSVAVECMVIWQINEFLG